MERPRRPRSDYYEQREKEAHVTATVPSSFVYGFVPPSVPTLPVTVLPDDVLILVPAEEKKKVAKKKVTK